MALVLVVLALSLTVGGASWVSAHTANSPLITLPDPEESTTLSQRVAQRKNTASLKLTDSQIQNIAGRCAAAQTRLKNVQTKDKSIADNRHQTYEGVATQLDAIINRLQNQNVDTAQLKTAQAKFNNAINKYLADALSYKTAIDDAVLVKCAADPQGFEATLQEARKLRVQLAKDSEQVKAQVPGLADALTGAKNSLLNAKESD